MTKLLIYGKIPLMEITRPNLLSLIKNGLKEKSLSISGLEKQASVPKDTIRDFLRGKTQILRADKLQKVLKILQPEEKLPVRHIMNSDAEIVTLPPSEAREPVEIPPGFDAESVVAVRIASEAMAPVFHVGWVVYYCTEPAPMPPKTTEGWQVPYGAKNTGNDPYAIFHHKPCVIETEEGRLMLRTLKPSSPGRYTLAGYNTADKKDVSVRKVHKIIFIKTT